MSFDLAVWYPSKKLTNEEAEECYEQLCEGIVDQATPHEAISKAEYVEDLVTRLALKHSLVVYNPQTRQYTA
ncbi:hypothetical protein B9G55_22790 [Saccharibacillus sp. O16]|nr:hypothetical protein B9G55_22790 [Saccharibacillus sp. O16]